MDDPTSTELPKIRRAALGLSLVSLVFLLADVTIDQAAALPVFGLKVKIGRADLIPLWVTIAGVYCAARYYYYGFLLQRSPYRRRRRLLRVATSGTKGRVWSYFGPVHLGSDVTEDMSTAARTRDAFPEAWPQVLDVRASAEMKSDEIGVTNVKKRVWRISATLPRRCRLLALLQDIDYASPTIVPVAVAIWFGCSR